LDARSSKSFRPGFEERAAIAAATKPESDVHAAIRFCRAGRDHRLRKEGGTGLRHVAGAGERASIAGADIGELAKATPIEAERQTRNGQALLNLV
jgi:hypothetical protein